MKRIHVLAATAAAALSLGIAGAANAALVYVGSWSVYNASAPTWYDSGANGPLAYTGQEAAAVLFGGNAADYQISTIDNLVANINNLAHYDVIGYGHSIFSESYSNKYLGQYYGPASYPYGGQGANNAASAFVRDNLQYVSSVNYAFRDDGGAVPEPATWALMIGGFGLAGAALRRRRAVATAA